MVTDRYFTWVGRRAGSQMRKRLVAENVGAMRCAGRKEEWGFSVFCGDGAPDIFIDSSRVRLPGSGTTTLKASGGSTTRLRQTCANGALSCSPQSVRPRLRRPYEALFPEVRFDAVRGFQARLRFAKRMIIDNNVTTVLEALAANVPTIAYWRDDRWEVRLDAEAAFDALRMSAFYIQRPSLQAAHLSGVAANPSRWWGQSEVVNARDAFVAHLHVVPRNGSKMVCRPENGAISHGMKAMAMAMVFI